MIDQTALINAVSNEMVEKLEIPMTPLHELYFLRIGDNKLAITITQWFNLCWAT
jgi:hypothetical protein